MTCPASLRCSCGLKKPARLWPFHSAEGSFLGFALVTKGLCSSTLRQARFSQRLHFAADRSKSFADEKGSSPTRRFFCALTSAGRRITSELQSAGLPQEPRLVLLT